MENAALQGQGISNQVWAKETRRLGRAEVDQKCSGDGGGARAMR